MTAKTLARRATKNASRAIRQGSNANALGSYYARQAAQNYADRLGVAGAAWWAAYARAYFVAVYAARDAARRAEERGGVPALAARKFASRAIRQATPELYPNQR